MTLADLIFELSEAAESATTEVVFLNVAGRWTGIKSVYVEGDTGGIFIESED
jgi:hypothetical protein